jgi:tetratricopeptide (TPR) repeat protein
MNGYKKEFLVKSIVSGKIRNALIASTSILMFLLIVFSCSADIKEDVLVRVHIKQGVNPEYLTMSEKIILDFYGNETDRDASLSLLKERCEDNYSNNSHACYNYAVLLFNLQKHEESLVYIKKAVEKSPEDVLYNSMFRNMANMLEHPESLENNEEGNMVANFTRIEVACRNKNEELVLQLVEQMKDSKILHETLFRNGTFSECLSSENQSALLKSLPKNNINYKELYYQEKSQSDPFSALWDVSYFIKKSELEKELQTKMPITEAWRNLRLAVRSGNSAKAKIELRSFLDEIKKGKEQKKAYKSKFTALERAAFYLIEQDDFFKQYRDQLLVEF